MIRVHFIVIVILTIREIIFPAYFSTQREYNIIAVDYFPIANSLKCYRVAVRNLPVVGKCVARFLDAVFNEHRTFDYVHAIGFSLGAQVAALVGKLLKAKGKILNRITGEERSNVLLLLFFFVIDIRAKHPYTNSSISFVFFSPRSGIASFRSVLEYFGRAVRTRCGRHSHEQWNFRTSNAHGYGRFLR